MSADGKQLGAAVHQQHLLAADVPDELAIHECVECDALGQIRAAGRSLFLCHDRLLCRHIVMLRNS
jgi:hypothetical protein